MDTKQLGGLDNCQTGGDNLILRRFAVVTYQASRKI